MMSSHLKKAAALLLPACTLLVLATNSSCYKDNKQDLYPAGACDTGTVTWTADIQPIINNSCTLSGCHDATASGGYNLTTYSGVKTIADNGRLLATTTSGSMPKNMAKLDDCSIAKLTRWVNTGAPNN
jgi:hypothetical protein